MHTPIIFFCVAMCALHTAISESAMYQNAMELIAADRANTVLWAEFQRRRQADRLQRQICNKKHVILRQVGILGVL